MPITSQKDSLRNLTIFTVRGVITTEELKSSAKSFWESKTLTLNLIWDVREASFSKMKYKDMDDILFHMDPYEGRLKERIFGKTAIVVNNDEQFDIMKQLKAYAEIQGRPRMPEVFITMGEAMAWLDQTESDLIASSKEDQIPTRNEEPESSD